MSKNGQLTSSELANVGGMQLATSTAQAWQAMVEAAEADGIALSIVRPAGAYRSLFVQGDMKKNPAAYNLNPASSVNIAAPGLSTHGDGRSVDISSFSGKRRVWVLANGARFGFTRPFGEKDPNHFHHDGTAPMGAPVIAPAESGTTTPVTVPEDVMTDKQYADLTNLVTNFDAAMNKRITNVEAILTSTKELSKTIAAKGSMRLVKNSETNRVALVGALTWVEANNVDEEYQLGRKYGLRAPGEKNSVGVDWFAKKYTADVLVNSEFSSLKAETLARISLFAK